MAKLLPRYFDRGMEQDLLALERLVSFFGAHLSTKFTECHQLGFVPSDILEKRA